MNGSNDNQEEEIQERPFNLQLTLRLLAYLKPYKLRVAGALCMIILSAASSQVGPLLTQIAVDDHILTGDLDGLSWILILFFGSVLLQYVASYFRTLITETTGQLVMLDLRHQIFAHIQRLPLRFFDRTRIGRLMTRTTSDVEALNEFFTDGIVYVFMDLFTLIAIVCYMSSMDLWLTFVGCAVVPFLFVVTFYLQGLAMKAYRELVLRRARLNAYLQENISGMEVVQLFGRQTRNRGEFDNEHIPYRNAQDQEINYYAIFFPMTEFISTIGVGAIIWFGAQSVLQGRVEMGVLIAFLQYVPRFFRPVMDINDRYALLQSAMASSERIFQLADTEAEPLGAPAGPSRKTSGGAIEFRDVWFKYDPTAPDFILKDVSFVVEAGESLALVGATGSGKSTIVNLICRFYDVQKGAVVVDGVDVREWNVEELRRRISIVQQDVFLFSGDIATNIRLGDITIDDVRVEQSARHVNADRFIGRTAGGYRQKVAERGSTFSSGERQLLSFARALAFDPEILILDEATSSIDTETELLIQDAVNRVMRERTSIVIAHRLSTIRNADHILVLHHGEVRERGRHDDLIQLDGIYARLYQLNYGLKPPASPFS